MALTSRERFISNALLIAVGMLIFNSLLLGYYHDKRKELKGELAVKTDALKDEEFTLQREKRLRQILAGLDKSMSADTTACEGQLLQLLTDWEQQAGLTNDSFERVRVDDEHGFARMTFQVSASGPMGAVAGLIYKVETAGIPLRVDSADMRPKAAGSDEVQVHLNVSALCHGLTRQSGAPVSASAMGAGGPG